MAGRVWRQQSLWSAAANAARRSIDQGLLVGLSLGIAAAVLGTVAAQTMHHNSTVGRTLAFFAALSAGLTPLAAVRFGPAVTRDWTRLRAASEALNGELYTFLAGVAPYRLADAAELLLRRTNNIIADSGDLISQLPSDSPEHRDLPAVKDVDSYARLRVAGQIQEHYRPRAALLARRVRLVRWGELALAAIAAILGLAGAVLAADPAVVWVATVTTIAAAVTAHGAAARYDHQQLEFSGAATELDNLLARRAARAEHTAWSDDEFVRRCEQVIATENQAWLAKWAADA